MSSPAISIRDLGKMYRLSHQGNQTDSFREAITSTFASPWRRLKQLRGADETMEEFWALKEVSFDVQPGEVVGIIGRNGAGKSTLLKILSRIVAPTRGEIVLRGRVASLLEVGTGFHPELTGRENIYMNGSILGMKKREIDAKFDEIVDFAEVEKFLDTPVKRYSSGMYVRLAFAVAAHLEPEILIVDEVLAVGDAEFQKKCLGKMQGAAKGTGKTVLFVSHNMAAVRSLCSKAVMLKEGELFCLGSSEDVIQRYITSYSDVANSAVELSPPTSAGIWMTRACVMSNGEFTSSLPMGSEISIQIAFETSSPTKHPRFGLVISSMNGEKILNTNNRFQPSPEFETPVSSAQITCHLGQLPLVAGKYCVSLYLGDQAQDHHVELEALLFEVTEKDIWGLGKIPPSTESLLWWPSTFAFSSGNRESG